MDAYDFTAPPVIRFGSGRVVEAGAVVRASGCRAWLLTGGDSFDARGGPAAAIASSLEEAGVPWERIGRIRGEPTVSSVGAVVRETRRLDSAGAVVLAVGGGAVLDAAKAVAAVALDSGPQEPEELILDRLEGIGRGMPDDAPVLPVVAVPTTAGTGAEATRNAVIGCPERRLKRSIRSPLLVPRGAIVDPALTATCTRDVAAWCGLDCLTQLIESFVSRFRRPIPRALVRQALPGAVRGLPMVVAEAGRTQVEEPAHEARAAVAHAALVSGLALANSGLGMAHGVAAALGGACGVPHGLACAVLLPIAMRVNRAAVEADFAELERLVDAAAPRSDSLAADRFRERIESLCAELGVPRRLSAIGVAPEQIDWLARNSGGSSMRGNPVDLSTDHLLEVLTEAM
jgi:alcohol dehydrogenase class IV